MTNVFDKGQPLFIYAKKKFNGKLFKAASANSLGTDLTQNKKDWEATGYDVKILKLPKEKVQILYLRER